MSRGTDTDLRNVSENESTDIVDTMILQALASGPKSASQLMDEVMNSARCSRPKYFKRLAVLRDDTRRVIRVLDGKKAHYGLPNDLPALGRLLKKQGRLEQYVVDHAYYLLELAMRRMDYQRPGKDIMNEMAFKSHMLLTALDRLRDSYPDLPEWESPTDDKDLDEGVIIYTWYEFWMNVLVFLKAL